MAVTGAGGRVSWAKGSPVPVAWWKGRSAWVFFRRFRACYANTDRRPPAVGETAVARSAEGLAPRGRRPMGNLHSRAGRAADPP